MEEGDSLVMTSMIGVLSVILKRILVPSAAVNTMNPSSDGASVSL